MGWRETFAAFRSTGRAGRAAREALERARSASTAKDWSAAAAAWQRVVEDPDVAALGAEPWRELARAQRLVRDLDGARASVAAGLARHPDDLGLTVEQARVALRGYATSAEDVRHAWKAYLLDAEASLTAARDAGRTTKHALRAAGEIALVRRRWDEAVTLWQELAERYPEHRVEAAVNAATALRSAGDLASARSVLDALGPLGAASEDVAAVARLITASERVAAATAAFATASERWHRGERDVLVRELPDIIADRGHPAGAVEPFHPLLDDLESLLAGAPLEPLPDGPSDPGPRDVVVVSGFLYSGSGAVLDLLRHHPAFHLPFEDKETGFLKKPRHLATIVDELDGDGRPVPAVVADAVLASTFGFGQTGRPLLGWVAPGSGPDGLAHHLRTLVRALAHARSGTADPAAATRSALRVLVDRVVADRTPRGRTALLNNAIVGHQLDRLELISDSLGIAVLRDPRDQYVSQRLESPFALPADAFVTMMAERYDAIERLLSTPQVGERIVPVRFERFVEDASSRAALVERLEVGPLDGLTGGFDPERSRANIAIHRAYPDRDALGLVTETLLDRYGRLTADW